MNLCKKEPYDRQRLPEGAYNRSISESIANPDAVTSYVTKRYIFSKRDIEKDRLPDTFNAEMSHAKIAKFGQLLRARSFGEIFDYSFLPSYRR